MDGATKDSQTIFNSLYNTINAIAQEGKLAQGRDIGQHLQKIVSSSDYKLFGDWLHD